MRDPAVVDAVDAPEHDARAFDEISDETGVRYSAAAFPDR